MREVEGKTLKDIVQYGLKAVLDLLVPRRCIVCESALASSEKHLCQGCLDDIPHTYYWLRKFNPMADKFNALIQEELERMSLDGTHHYHVDYSYATALFFYRADSDYSHISRQLKYHSNIPAGKFFGQQLGARLARAEHLADVDAVIPIPLHWTRKWSRGYNQAEVIAREVATALGVDLRADILERCRRTRTQTKLSIKDKAANVKGAFRVRPDIVQSSGSGTKKADASAISDLKHLLIIDDIFTTGSTALACYSALRDTFPPSVRISIATLGFVGEA
jgi:predicted amidophosphoribosyltransferase